MMSYVSAGSNSSGKTSMHDQCLQGKPRWLLNTVAGADAKAPTVGRVLTMQGTTDTVHVLLPKTQEP